MSSNEDGKLEVVKEADINVKVEEKPSSTTEEKKSEDDVEPDPSTDPDPSEEVRNGESVDKANSIEGKESVEEGNSGSDGAPCDDENEGPDDDEDAKNPAYIPRKGAFYMHDSRKDDEEDRKAEEAQKKSRADKKWTHDLYDDRQQRPKSTQELVRKYGYNIREAEKTEKEMEMEEDKSKRNRRNDKGKNSPRNPEDRRTDSGAREGRRREAPQGRRMDFDEKGGKQERRPRETVRGGGGTHFRGPPKERQGPQLPRARTNDVGTHFKRTIVPSNNKKPERRESSNRNGYNVVEQGYDNNQNTRGGKRPTSVKTSDMRKPQTPPQHTANGTPPKQPSTPSTPRSSNVPQQPPFSPHVAIVPPMMPSVPGNFVPPPVVPIAVVPVVPPTTAPLPANYPHPRQPTETVYFDPNSQTNVPRTPPQPRERRTLEIAPPTQ